MPPVRTWWTASPREVCRPGQPPFCIDVGVFSRLLPSLRATLPLSFRCPSLPAPKMQVSNSILPPHALASICMSPSKSTNRLGPLSSGSMPGLGQAVTPQFVYTQELGWTPVNPHALMQLQAQGGYFSQLAESAMQAVAHARHPFPASNTIQGNVDALASQYEHPQALHAAEVQPSATSQELVRPTAPISKRKRKRAAKAKSTPNPVKSDLGPFVYVHPSEEVLRAIRERALFHAPMCEPRRRVAQACEACRKRKIKVSLPPFVPFLSQLNMSCSAPGRDLPANGVPFVSSSVFTLRKAAPPE